MTMLHEPVCRAPLAVEILVVILLAVLPDIVSSFTFYLSPDPGTPTFLGTHGYLLARSLQIASVILLMINFTTPVRFLSARFFSERIRREQQRLSAAREMSRTRVDVSKNRSPGYLLRSRIFSHA